MVREVESSAKGPQGSWRGGYKAHRTETRDLGSDPRRSVKDKMLTWSLQGGVGTVRNNGGRI